MQKEPPFQHTVGVVDDDPAVRNSLKFALEIEGFRVCLYASVAELLTARDLYTCDCLVVDQRMPEISGLDLIGILRQRQVFSPAVLITSHPSAILKARAAMVHIPIVEKPLLNNILVDTIRASCTQGNTKQQ